MYARNGHEKYNRLCPRRMDRSGREAEIRRAAGEMLRKISFVYRKKNAGHGIPGEEICKMEKLENAGKQFDSGTLTRYNASRDYIALYLAREQ